MNSLTNIQSNAIVESITLTDDLYKRWVNYIDASPKTIQTYKASLRQFFAWMQREGIAQPTREDILSYRDYLKQEHKPTTVQNYIAAVKLFFKWTEQEGFYPNVADRVKGAKIDKGHKKDYLTSSQTKRMLTSIDRRTVAGARDYAIIFLMVTTGLRTISIRRANVEDLRTVGNSSVLFYQGKGKDGKTDYAKLSEPVETAIREYLALRSDLDLKDPLFASTGNRNKNGRMTTRSLSRIAKESLIEAGFNSDRLTAHSLRHTAATLNLLNGGTVQETQQLLGHSNINTTMIYSHALERANNNSEMRITDAIMK